MKRGYTAQIGNEFVFVEAKDINEAIEKLKANCSGQHWLMDKTIHYKVI